METTTRLSAVFREVFDDESIVLRDDLTAADIEEWDSLAQIRLVVAAEQEFDVRFTQIEIEELANVGDFIRLIEEKMAG